MTPTELVSVSETDLEQCAAEPIHLPGSVQAHGVLFAVDATDLAVQQVSENVEPILGRAAAAVLGRPIAEIFEADTQGLAKRLRRASSRFINPLRLHLADGRVCDAVVHKRDGLIVLELENIRDESSSTDDRAVALDLHFRLVERTLADIRPKERLRDVCDVVAKRVRIFTGFDRVMVYRFAGDGHGEVIAEQLDPALEPLLGLHFPESDIPKQARALYKKNLVRLIADVDAPPARLLSTAGEADRAPLDLTHSVLRSVSPVHIRYLQNMQVGASMSISIVRGDDLWGLIACHHRTAKVVPYGVRASCVMLATVLGAQIGIAEQAQRSAGVARKRQALGRLVSDLARAGDLAAGVEAHGDAMLALVAAQSVVLCLEDQLTRSGKAPPDDVVLALVAFLREREHDHTDVIICDDALRETWPPAAEHQDTASGVLALRLGGDDWLFFFRPETRRPIHWGGDPSKPAVRSADPGARLEPRSSFAAWTQSVAGRCLPWTAPQIRSARELRSALTAIIIDHGRALAKVNRELQLKSEEVEQFVYSVSHDLRSPLVSCKGFLGLLREDLEAGRYEALADSARELETATEHMRCVIDDLLEISRIGRDEKDSEPVDVHAVVREIVEWMRESIRTSGAEVRIEADLPRVEARRSYVVRIFENLLENALKYACDGAESVIEIGSRRGQKEICYFVRDYGPGVPAPYREKVFALFQRLHPDRPGTGLGLASVAKMVQRLDGRVWIESTPNSSGATFCFSVPTDRQRRQDSSSTEPGRG